MKLLRFGAVGEERLGVLDKSEHIRDASAILRDLTANTLSTAALDDLSQVDPSTLPLVPEDTRIGPCIGGTRNFIAIGLNYADHAEEAGMTIPDEPVVFNKAPSSIAGPNDTIPIPYGAERLDWEVELALVMKETTYRVSEEDALSYVAGFCICNDLSERSWQLERAGQWAKGKSAPGFGPLGPWLVTVDEVLEPLDLTLLLTVNGEEKQVGSTSSIIFSPSYLVSYLSNFMVLQPGDVITTGTPAGVGLASDCYLKSGDELRLTISGLGEQHTKVIA